MDIELIPFKKVPLRNYSSLDEKWIQERIAEDPSILGLGDLVLKDKERIQAGAGRLDLLLQEPETKRRYEVEIQMGKTDESHIIRTIEYWDIEKKRYPQYDHCAILIAEDITSRFLNIIHLFNGHIPFIAIQMNAYEVDGKLGLVFTKVVDELRLGLEDEDEELYAITDRSYWEMRGSKETVKLADSILNIIKEFDNDFEIKYNKYYIGLAKNGQAKNFTIFRAKKNNLRMEVKIERSDEIAAKLESSGLDVMEYDSRSERYRIRLTKEDVDKSHDLIKEILKKSYDDCYE
jgi:hypothetical protein